MKRHAFFAAIILSLWVASAFAADTKMLAIIPQPQEIQCQPGSFRLTQDTKITFAGGEAEAQWLAKRLRSATGFKLPVTPVATRPGQSEILVLLQTNLATPVGTEAYRLSVSPKFVTISASTAAGLFYGAQTFLQLLPPEIFSADPVAGVKWQAPCASITDQPRFAWRGLLVDVSRHFLTAAELKKIIDVMALHKLNLLHLHLTDDQGWRLEIKKYPRLTEFGSVRKESPKPGKRKEGDGQPYGPFFYTQEQIRDLVAYAQARHVTIMPEIEMPGHLLGLLAAYPEYSCTGGPFEVGTRWGVKKEVLCLGNTNSVAFMEDILTEVLDLFSSPFIHIGGDEVPRDRWKSCPKCQALMRAEGLTKEAQLQTWFNHQIETFLASKGRRMIGWDEILEGGLTPGAAVMSWRGVKGGIAAAEAGHDVVMSPNLHLYLDYAQANGPGEPESIGGFVPLDKTYSYDPVPVELSSDKAGRILGAQGNLWSEYIWSLKDFEYKAYPRACALAELTWSSKASRNFNDFKQRLQIHERRLGELGVNFRPDPLVEHP